MQLKKLRDTSAFQMLSHNFKKSTKLLAAFKNLEPKASLENPSAPPEKINLQQNDIKAFKCWIKDHFPTDIFK